MSATLAGSRIACGGVLKEDVAFPVELQTLDRAPILLHVGGVHSAGGCSLRTALFCSIYFSLFIVAYRR